MRAEGIIEHELDFDNRGLDGHDKYHLLTRQSIDIPGETETINYIRVKPQSGDESYFYHSQTEKKQIVLHYTMGYLKGDIAILTTPDNHISVPFLIGRNGTIYNLFFSGYWAYHLGRGALGGNTTRSKATIGIEMSNIGPLIRHEDRLATYYSESDIYCTLEDNALYQEKSYRRFQYYATFTDAQYTSLIKLLRYLTARYNIRREILAVPQRLQAFHEIVAFNGIVSHANYRSHGKEDIGPAFDWDRIVGGMRS